MFNPVTLVYCPFFLLRPYYFELSFAARLDGGITPFSGRSFSIASERLCSGRSCAEESCGPAVATVRFVAVYIASLKAAPSLALATAYTPCGVPLLNTVAM